MERKIKVRLLVDLTKYHSGLKAGTEGFTVGSYGIWSRNNDRFVGVNFPGFCTLDVLWESLEIIDKEFLKEIEEKEKVKMAEFKSATNVTKYVGPRGGFRYLSYEYIDQKGIRASVSNGFKGDSEKLEAIFKEYGIDIQTKTIM